MRTRLFLLALVTLAAFLGGPSAGALLDGTAPALPPGTSAASVPPADASSPRPAGAPPLDASAPVPFLPPGVEPSPIHRLIGLAASGAAVGDVAAAFTHHLESTGVIPAQQAGPNDEVGEWYHRFYRAGDVTGDGIDEVILDSDCVDRDACGDSPDPTEVQCSGTLPKKLRVVDGRDLEDVWSMRLNEPFGARAPLDPPLDEVPFSSALGCVYDFVVGVVPNAHGTNDILVYEWTQAMVPYPGSIHHDYFLVDSATGNVLWHYRVGVPPGLADADNPTQGLDEPGFSYGYVAKNYLLVPILQVPPTEGTPFLPAQHPHLIVRSLGWVAAQRVIQLPQAGYVGYVAYYGADEWAAAVDLATGEQLWKRDTFQPLTDRSLVPWSFEQPHPITQVPCCFDLTKDEVPEAVFSTYEFCPTDLVTQGCGVDGAASRLLILDGANGDTLHEYYVEPGSQRLLAPASVAALGDADGDGGGDFALYAAYGDVVDGRIENLEVVTQVTRGTDAETLWSDTLPEAALFLPLGDANADGGNDLLAFGSGTLDTFANFTKLSLTLREGDTGDALWSRTSTVPVLDLAQGLKNLARNGMGDFDQDGVADVFLDEPEFLADQTVVHRTTWVSGRTGEDLTESVAVGMFLFPMRGGDLTGDGRDDFLIVQGDLVDVWVTAYDGEDATPLWSRRVFTVQSSSPFQITPTFTLFPIELDGAPGRDLLLQSELMLVDFGGLSDKGGGTSSQAYGLHGADGKILWSIPVYDEGDASLLIGQPTPATSQYVAAAPEGTVPENAGGVASAAAADERGDGGGFPTGLVTVGIVTAASLGVAYVLAGRKFLR